VLPALERHHDVLALTLAGHAGGPALEGPVTDATLADAVERAMDGAGFEIAHLVGNSLGGYVAFQLAARGRARSVVALDPAGGWAPGDDSYKETLEYFATMQESLAAAAPQAPAILSTPEGRRRATRYIVERFEHIPTELLVHQMLGAARCPAARPLIDLALREGWTLDGERIAGPMRIVWGTADRLTRWPEAAARYRSEWAPHADWVVLEDVGHCPQLDVPVEAGQLILGLTSG
jgi:pimeloyl-ACP methyl ester carboxylesterase